MRLVKCGGCWGFGWVLLSVVKRRPVVEKMLRFLRNCCKESVFWHCPMPCLVGIVVVCIKELSDPGFFLLAYSVDPCSFMLVEEIVHVVPAWVVKELFGHCHDCAALHGLLDGFH